MITIRQRHRQTDGRSDGQTTCLGNTALRVASHGNNLDKLSCIIGEMLSHRSTAFH